jgi:hypothetical protein
MNPEVEAAIKRILEIAVKSDVSWLSNRTIASLTLDIGNANFQTAEDESVWADCRLVSQYVKSQRG